MVTEQRVRAALEHMAGRAPDPERIRAGLQRRARVHRQRRALLVAGGVAAAAGAVAVPSVVLLPRSPERSLLGAGPVSLRYRPAWLPAGFVESSRSATVRDGRVAAEARVWKPSEELGDSHGYGPVARIWMDARPEAVDLSGRTAPVMVGRVEGGLFRDGETLAGRAIYRVAWPRGDGGSFTVTVRSVDDSDEVALRVAESVAPDADAVLEPPVEPGWLPEQVPADPYHLSVFESGYGVEADLGLGGAGRPTLRFHLGGIWGGPSATPEQRRTVTVRDTSVLLYLAERSWSAHLVLDDGRNLVIDAGQGVSDEDLLRVWEQLHVLPLPDTSWMG